MANELDKTIEELEAEVIAELEEGAHDAPMKGATAAEPMKKKKVTVQQVKKISVEAHQVKYPHQQVQVHQKEQKRFLVTHNKKVRVPQKKCLNSKRLKKVIQMTKLENFVILKTTIVQQS